MYSGIYNGFKGQMSKQAWKNEQVSKYTGQALAHRVAKSFKLVEMLATNMVQALG